MMYNDIFLNIGSNDYENLHLGNVKISKDKFNGFFDELYKIYKIFELSPTPAQDCIKSNIEAPYTMLLSIGLSCINQGCSVVYTNLVLENEIFKTIKNNQLLDETTLIKMLIIKEMIGIIRSSDIHEFSELVSRFCTNDFRIIWEESAKRF